MEHDLGWVGIEVGGYGSACEHSLWRAVKAVGIPPEIGGLTAGRLHIYRQALKGPIPDELGLLTNLRELDLGRNDLTGVMPASLGLLSNLTKMSAGNRLHGPLPPALGQLANLKSLRVQENSFPIPCGTGAGAAQDSRGCHA